MEKISNLKFNLYAIYFAYSLPTDNNQQLDEHIVTSSQIEDALKAAKGLKKNWIKNTKKRQTGGYYCVVDNHMNIIAIY